MGKKESAKGVQYSFDINLVRLVPQKSPELTLDDLPPIDAEISASHIQHYWETAIEWGVRDPVIVKYVQDHYESDSWESWVQAYHDNGDSISKADRAMSLDES